MIDATLAPGERNVIARRRFSVHKDTWIAGPIDKYDSQGNLWKVLSLYNEVRPDIPGTLYASVTLTSGAILLSSASGAVFISRDQGNLFQRLRVRVPMALFDMAQAANGDIITVGNFGVMKIAKTALN